MEIYVRLPLDIKKIIDRMIFDINHAQVIKQINNIGIICNKDKLSIRDKYLEKFDYYNYTIFCGEYSFNSTTFMQIGYTKSEQIIMRLSRLLIEDPFLISTTEFLHISLDKFLSRIYFIESMDGNDDKYSGYSDSENDVSDDESENCLRYVNNDSESENDNNDSEDENESGYEKLLRYLSI